VIRTASVFPETLYSEHLRSPGSRIPREWYASCKIPAPPVETVCRMECDRQSNGIRELYANFFQIGYNSAEFLLDFGRHFENSEGTIYQRIIMTPVHAKILLRLLSDSVGQYETKFGSIPDQDMDGI
jgi:hypothetical protein